MWTVLGPLLLFVVVILFQLGKTKEHFATDASGNTTDASGSTVSTSTAGMIQLSFSDLLKLFSATAPAAQTTQPKTSITEAIQEVVATNPETPAQLYEKLRPSVLQDIKSQLQGAPFEPAAPIPSSCDPSSDAMAQGAELMDAKANLENNAEYIRKDSIPCYGCSL